MLNLEHIETNNDLLNDAFIQRSYGPQQLKIYDDCLGDLYVYGQEYGPQLLIRAMSWDDAYSIAIDESTTIDSADLFEAYGFDNDSDYTIAINTMCEGDEYPELSEGYTYQSNSTGTGIVFNGYHEWLSLLSDWNNNLEQFDNITPVFIED